jgi:hypothetical protein
MIQAEYSPKKIVRGQGWLNHEFVSAGVDTKAAPCAR